MTSAVGPEHNKQLVRKIVEEMFNKGSLDVAPEIIPLHTVYLLSDARPPCKGFCMNMRCTPPR